LESNGEKAIASFLSDVGLRFERQKRFESCHNFRPLRFDFYVSNTQILIEFQGQQHFRPIEVFGGKKGFESTRVRDRIKRKWARKNGFNLVEIKYNEDVEKVLQDRLLLKRAA
jgi:very-short-patch-repair endonuclease